MEQTQEVLTVLEPDHPRREMGIQMAIPPTGCHNDTDVDNLVVKRLVFKINRQHAAAIRMLKGSLTAMARTGEALVEAQANLGGAYPHWVQTKLPLSRAEADFLACLCSAKSGINEKDLSPTRDVKLPRLVELLEELVSMWHSRDLADETLEGTGWDSAGEQPPIAECVR